MSVNSQKSSNAAPYSAAVHIKIN